MKTIAFTEKKHLCTTKSDYTDAFRYACYFYLKEIQGITPKSIFFSKHKLSAN